MTAMMPKAQDNYREFRNALGRFTAGNPGAGRLNKRRAGMQALLDTFDGHIQAMVTDGEVDRAVESIIAKAEEKHGSGLIGVLKELQSLGILPMLMAQADRDTGSDDNFADGSVPTGITICMYEEEPQIGFDATKAIAAKNPTSDD